MMDVDFGLEETHVYDINLLTCENTNLQIQSS